MRIKTITIISAAIALAACGQDGTPEREQPASASAGSHGSDNSWLWGLGGYVLGRATAPSPAPAAPAPVYIDRRTVVQRPAVAAAPQKPTPAPVAPPPKPSTPTVTTSPRVAPPTPTAAPRPSYSGPSSYRSVTQSAPSYSRSYSSPSVGRR